MMVVIGFVAVVVVAGLSAFVFIYSRNIRRAKMRNDILEPHVTRSLPRVDYSKKPTKATPPSHPSAQTPITPRKQYVEDVLEPLS